MALNQDFESLTFDPISGDIYLAQKNIYRNDVTLYKVIIVKSKCSNLTDSWVLCDILIKYLIEICQFTPPADANEKIMLQDVGKLPAIGVDHRRPGYCKGVQWPMCLTAADVSTDGNRIILRNYDGRYIIIQTS